MSLEVAIAENTAALHQLIAALANGLPTSAAQVATVATEAKADKPKAQAEKVKEAPKQEKAEAVAAATPEAKDGGAPAISLQDVIDATLALGKAGKRAVLVELLEGFGVAKSSLLDESDYSAFHTKATELLEG